MRLCGNDFLPRESILVSALVGVPYRNWHRDGCNGTSSTNSPKLHRQSFRQPLLSFVAAIEMGRLTFDVCVVFSLASTTTSPSGCKVITQCFQNREICKRLGDCVAGRYSGSGKGWETRVSRKCRDLFPIWILPTTVPLCPREIVFRHTSIDLEAHMPVIWQMVWHGNKLCEF